MNSLILSRCDHNRLPDKEIRPGFNWNLTPVTAEA
jgi:hypothetical protein